MSVSAPVLGSSAVGGATATGAATLPAILLITQELGTLANYCDRVLVLHQGRLLADGLRLFAAVLIMPGRRRAWALKSWASLTEPSDIRSRSATGDGR